MIVYGPDFDRERPWAGTILNGPGEGRSKMERLFREARTRFPQEGRRI
jgi:hypothetical protein